MQVIHLFLASSIPEFDYERQAIGNFIRSLNDMYAMSGIYFRLHMCEDMTEEVTHARKQESYNEIARSCDYFFMLVHRKAGEYTLEEFESALSAFQRNQKAPGEGKPLIVAFVKPLREEEQSPELRRFLDRYCGELQQYPSLFDSVDTVKLKILLHLERSLGSAMELSLRDSALMIGGKPFDCLQLSRVPMYARSEAITDLREELAELTKELDALRCEEGGEESAAYRRRLRTLERTRNELWRMEEQLIGTAKSLCAFLSSGRGATERARQAALLLDEGQTEQALAVLNDEMRRRELALATERADRALAEAADAMVEVQRLVDEALIKIEALRLYPVTSARAEEMIALYREAESSILRYHLDRAPLIPFAVLLREQNRYEEATALAESLYDHYLAHPEAPARTRAEVCDILGRLYYLGHKDTFPRTEELYLAAIRLAEEAGDAAEVSYVCNNLGYYYKAVCRMAEAKAAMERSCEIRRALAAEDERFRAKYAWSVNSLADVCAEMGEHERAAALYREALAIRRAEAERSFTEIVYVSRTCDHLSNVCVKLGALADARAYATEALEIRRALACDNPAVHSGTAAQSCISLAECCLAEGNALEEAAALLDEGEQLLSSCCDAFEPERRADLCLLRARLAEQRGESGESFLREALSLRRKRAENGAIALEIEVARDSLSLVHCLINRGERIEATSLLGTAENTLRRYLSCNPAVCAPLLAECERERKRI